MGVLEAHGKLKRQDRPWSRVTRTPQGRDWVGEIARIAQRPGAERLAPQLVADPVMDTDAFRRRIAEGRAEAIARSRLN